MSERHYLKTYLSFYKYCPKELPLNREDNHIFQRSLIRSFRLTFCAEKWTSTAFKDTIFFKHSWNKYLDFLIPCFSCWHQNHQPTQSQSWKEPLMFPSSTSSGDTNFFSTFWLSGQPASQFLHSGSVHSLKVILSKHSSSFLTIQTNRNIFSIWMQITLLVTFLP